MESREILEKGAFYHIYNRGNNKENLFLEEENYTYFLTLVSKYLLPVSDIYAYCLLKNHFHFLIQLKEISNLEEKKIYQPFSNLFNAYSKAINKKYDREGSLFRKTFKRKKITDEQYLINTIIYIHLNPVKHEFTRDFKEYTHSSFQSILSDKPTKLNRAEILEMFSGKENFIASHQMKVLEKFDLEL